MPRQYSYIDKNGKSKKLYYCRCGAGPFKENEIFYPSTLNFVADATVVIPYKTTTKKLIFRGTVKTPIHCCLNCDKTLFYKPPKPSKHNSSQK